MNTNFILIDVYRHIPKTAGSFNTIPYRIDKYQMEITKSKSKWNRNNNNNNNNEKTAELLSTDTQLHVLHDGSQANRIWKIGAA